MMLLQKHCDFFTKTVQWFGKDITIKNRKARKQPEKWLLKARNGAKTTVFSRCFVGQTDSKWLLFALFYTCSGLVDAHIVNTSFLFMLFCQKVSAKYSVFSGATSGWSTNKRNKEGLKY
ncbi:MAG: hypothetical protein LBF62_01940 [Tannerellaceae bacterium]|jgi:hypothetical protein|nr:hypothetical protein [Tannerellaceae bacterium]